MRGGRRGTGSALGPWRNDERDFHGDKCNTAALALKADTVTLPPPSLNVQSCAASGLV